MGNAFTGAVLDALQTDVSRTFQTLDAEKFEDCGACRYLRICGGGCRARSLFESGNLESKDSYCLMTQESTTSWEKPCQNRYNKGGERMLFYSEVDTYANCPVLGFGGICIAPGF